MSEYLVEVTALVSTSVLVEADSVQGAQVAVEQAMASGPTACRALLRGCGIDEEYLDTIVAVGDAECAV